MFRHNFSDNTWMFFDRKLFPIKIQYLLLEELPAAVLVK